MPRYRFSSCAWQKSRCCAAASLNSARSAPRSQNRYRRAERRIEPYARSEAQNRGQLDASATGSCQARQLPAVIGFDRAMRTNLNTQAGTGRHESVFRSTRLKVVLPIPAGIDEDQSLGLIRDAVQKMTTRGPKLQLRRYPVVAIHNTI